MRDFSLTLTLSRQEREPSALQGPHDSEYLFDRFLEMVKMHPLTAGETGV